MTFDINVMTRVRCWWRTRLGQGAMQCPDQPDQDQVDSSQAAIIRDCLGWRD